MGLFSFLREAGEKLFGSHKEVEAVQASAATAETDAAAKANIDALNDKAANAIDDYIRAQNLEVTGLKVYYDTAAATVSVYGVAANQATKEKVLLCCGNVQGVAHVDDHLSVPLEEVQGQFYTVVKGDTLSKIAREFYGNANHYMPIFHDNEPMLAHPDKIYPGQVLRIPPKA